MKTWSNFIRSIKSLPLPFTKFPNDWKVQIMHQQNLRLRDRSFFMREGGAGGIWGGGHSKKIGLKGGASRKKMKERGGGSDEKIRLKIG